ncbi:MAG: D-alanyl-D-alanine carboxypeptidase family protein [Candidatus Dormibacterales bacterium]
MRLRVIAVLLVLIGGYLAFNYFIRPIPAVAATQSVPAASTIAGQPPALPWPSAGSAAAGVSGLGLVASSGKETPAPALAIAKVMTALIVLEDKPLKVGDLGPAITITDADVQAYQAAQAAQQPAVEVQSGEQLSEFKALEGLLVPSAENFAYTLARWDAGSVNAFVAKMNKSAKELRMSHTSFADAGGASARTVSTPSDLVRLGVIAMKQPVLAAIVAITEATMPVAGTFPSLDAALGRSGIIGIEVGSGSAGAANFLFAASATVGNFTITTFGCLMGQPSLAVAFAAAEALADAMKPTLQVVRVASKLEPVGSYDLPWSDHTDLVSTANVELVEWPGMVLRQSLQAPAITVEQPVDPGTQEGVLRITLGDYDIDVPLSTANTVFPPGRFWRATRI